jgi:AbrB family looped-hinge helix DNA binding protein
MTTTLSAKGQIVIPRAIRAQDELRPGDDFVIERVGPGRIVLERISRRAQGAKVVRRKKGLPIVKPPKGAPRLTSQAVKALEIDLFR